MRHLFTRRACPELEMLVAVSECLRDGNGFLRDSGPRWSYHHSEQARRLSVESDPVTVARELAPVTA